MDNDHELPMLLEKASFWYYSDQEQCFIPTIMKQRYYVSEAALVAYHTLLPAAIRALLIVKEGLRDKEPRADGLLVRNSAKLLTNGVIRLTDITGKRFQMVEVNGMTRVDADNTVALWGEQVGIKYKVNCDVEIPFVHTRGNVHFHMSQTLLTQQYPGWLDRLATAEALGLPMRERSRFVLIGQDGPGNIILPSEVTFA